MIDTPLKTEPILKPKVWGGDRLSAVGKRIRHGSKIGESWEISTREGESNIIINGAFAGKTLREVVAQFPEEILGTQVLGSCGKSHLTAELPLIIKFLDATDKLSLQAHPDETVVNQFCETDGSKMEAWYVIDAAPDSFIYLGCLKNVNKDSLLRAIKLNQIESCLVKIRPVKGEVFFIPPGTLHCAGGGLTIFEVSENCDVTYRLYDWGREKCEGRELSVDRALSCAFPEKKRCVFAASSFSEQSGATLTCKKFSLEEIRLDCSSATVEFPSFATATVITGSVEIRSTGKVVTLSVGESALLPACLKKVEFCASSKSTLLLCRPGDSEK